MGNDFNTAGRAVYLPAVNNSFARQAVITDTTDRPFPAGLTIDDLVYWQKNRLFNYPYLLHSIGLYKVGAVDDTAVSRTERGSAVILGDSSGFQIGQGTLKGLEGFSANMPALQAIAAWNAASDVRNWILNWLAMWADGNGLQVVAAMPRLIFGCSIRKRSKRNLIRNILISKNGCPNLEHPHIQIRLSIIKWRANAF